VSRRVLRWALASWLSFGLALLPAAATAESRFESSECHTSLPEVVSRDPTTDLEPLPGVADDMAYAGQQGGGKGLATR